MFYALAAWNRYGLLAVIACLALNWLGDSLDGTLARVRQRQRPRYGFYVDHMVDTFGALALMGGLALSGYMHPIIAIGLLIAFLVLSIQSYLATYALGEFRISFWRFGPTELRILLSVGNLALFWKPVVHCLGGRYRLFDVGGTIGLAGMGLMVIAFTAQNTIRLYREDKDPAMMANSFPDNVLAGMQMRVADAKSWQAADTKAVDVGGSGENTQKSKDERRECAANSSRDNGMQAAGACATDSGLRNVLAVNDLRRSDTAKGVRQSEKNRQSLIAPSTLVRWCKFNLVGGIGIIVQFAALFFLRSVMHFHYLFATAIAVEAAVVHNFVWHERFTWADRVTAAPQLTSGAAAHNPAKRLFAALKRCATQRLCGSSLRRLLRFNLTTGAVSILGNVALMRVMVGQGHLNYLLANAAAIILCSLANFLVSETWVFQKDSSAT